MQKKIVVLMAIMFWFVQTAFGAPKIQIIKLKNVFCENVAQTLKQTFGEAIGVSEIGTVNGLCISSENPTVLQAAIKLAGELDFPLKNLNYSVCFLNEEDKKYLLLKGSSNGHWNSELALNLVEKSKNSSSIRNVTGLEGQEVVFVDISSRFFPLPGYGGGAIVNSEQGLRVQGRLVGNNTALVRFRFGSGDFSETKQVETEVKVLLSTWVPIGGLFNRSQVQGKFTPLKDLGIEAGKNSTISFDDIQFLFCVSEAKGN